MTEISSTTKKKGTTINCSECEKETIEPWAFTLSKIEGGIISHSSISKKVCETCAESINKKIAEITNEISSKITEKPARPFNAPDQSSAKPATSPPRHNNVDVSFEVSAERKVAENNPKTINNLSDWLIALKDVGAVVSIVTNLYEDLVGTIIAVDLNGLIIQTASRQVFISNNEIRCISSDI